MVNVKKWITFYFNLKILMSSLQYFSFLQNVSEGASVHVYVQKFVDLMEKHTEMNVNLVVLNAVLIQIMLQYILKNAVFLTLTSRQACQIPRRILVNNGPNHLVYQMSSKSSTRHPIEILLDIQQSYFSATRRLVDIYSV